MMRQKAFLCGLALSTLAATARADDKETCAQAYVQSQDLREQHRLIEARDALRTCAGAACSSFMKGEIVRQCAEWLDDVERRLPSVVPVAMRSGAEVMDAKIWIDGTFVVERSRAVALDPGPHTALFQAPDGSMVQVPFRADEGVTAKSVVGFFPAPSAPPVAPPRAPEPAGSPLRPTAVVVGILGVAALGIGSGFGIDAMNKKHDAGCDAQSVCPTPDAASTLREAKNEGNVSTVFFVSGGVLAAGGVALWLFAPSAHVQAAASVGAGTVGLTLRGAW